VNKNENNVFFKIFEQISKYSNDEIIITDKNFNIIFHNSKFINSVKSTSLFDLTGFIINADIKRAILKFSASKENHLLFKLLIKENKALNDIPVDFHISKIINNKNNSAGYCIIISNILQEIRNKIQKATFVDIITHDLKNPMRANIRVLDLILKEKFGRIGDDLKQVLRELHNSCSFMSRMADNLIIKYKNEIEIYEPEKQQYSIVKLIKEVCGKTNNILERKQQTIELIVEGEAAYINIDIKEMTKVIKNLIINASEQSLENSKIVIHVESKDNKVTVSFIDYGYKARQEILDNLFDEYISCSNKFRKIGFSLDLFNCKKIIEAHNGSIYAQNEDDNGTKISFSLPIE
jgi:K+-sensing histidine kinase KdpD